MSRHHRQAWLAAGVPVLAGLGLLAAGLLLLPGRREVLHAERRALPTPPEVASSPPPAATPAAVRALALPSAPPSIAAEVPTADAVRLAALTAQAIRDGQAVTTAQVAYDLVAAGRPAVALAYLTARPDGGAPATWRLRVDLLQRTGHAADAVALVAAAAARRGPIAATDLIAAAYAVDRPNLLIAAAASGAIPPPDAALALDLARRADAMQRGDLIATLDRATRADWRSADPWLAIRVATRGKDTAAALRAVDRLPPAQRDAARETILTGASDRAGLRTLWLSQAAAPDAKLADIAERLLAAGYRDDAETLLRRAALGHAVSSPATQRLLYLMGPRPGADDLVWLRAQAMRGDADEQAAWLDIYARRDRPAAALAFLSRHPLAARTDVMLTRLELARTAGNDAAARSLATMLLDGRPLDPAQLHAVAAAAPADPALAATLGRRRIAAGVAAPRDALDLAWAAWNAGDAAGTIRWLRDHIAATPDDLPALRLMADAQARIGGAAAARPWLERALAQAPANSRAHVELLDRLGRRGEAVEAVRALRAATPQDRTLAALHARLLIAQGQPGRAKAVLAP